MAAASGRSGVVRLAISTAQASSTGSGGARHLSQVSFQPLPVANLSALITFSLPQPATMAASSNGTTAGGAGLQAVCSFWDPAASNGAGAFATKGCVGQPSPLPPGLAARWVPNFTASGGAASLARAWNFTEAAWSGEAAPWLKPPLRSCTEAFIDCSNSSQALPLSSPQPRILQADGLMRNTHAR